MTQRLQQFDILKGLGIILVIIGHTVGENVIWKFIYSFHVPLFFLTSGYFLKEPTPSLAVGRLARNILLPYIVTGALMVALLGGAALLQGTFNWGGVLDLSLGVVTGSCVPEMPFHEIGPLWFLLALFWGTLIVRVALRLKALCPALLTILSGMILSLYLSNHDIQLIAGIRQGMFAALFIYLGYLVKLYWPQVSISGKLAWAPLLVIWLMSIKTGYLSVLRGYATPELITLIGALGGSYITYLLATRLAGRPWLARQLTAVGRMTLLILCVHALDFWAPWSSLVDAIPLPGIASQLVVAVLRVGIVLFAAHLLGKISFIRRLFRIQ